MMTMKFKRLNESWMQKFEAAKGDGMALLALSEDAKDFGYEAHQEAQVTDDPISREVEHDFELLERMCIHEMVAIGYMSAEVDPGMCVCGARAVDGPHCRVCAELKAE